MNTVLRETKRRILDSVRVWKAIVPENMKVTHVFLEGDVDTDSPDVIAETKTHWQYHQATVRWSLRNAAPLTQAEIDGTLVHELCHVLVAPIELPHRNDDEDSPWNDICEHTVEAVAKAIIRSSGRLP